MSEYQYYEFRAIDRRLSEAELRALRALSSRASITPTRFTNEYNYGDFRGSPEKLMAKHFDAHLYLANWGSHRLMLRVPRRILDEKTAAQYCPGRLAEVRKRGECIVLDFNAEDDSGDGEWEEGGRWLTSLIAIRAELLRGDLRALYLGWLLCVQSGDVDEDAVEPPLPPELGKLSAALRRFSQFLRIDPALIQVAAKKPAEHSLRRANGSRTAGALLAEARVRAEENERKAAAREAEAQARAEKKAAQAHQRRVSAVRKAEPAAWTTVDTLIAAGAPPSYDRAVELLTDLRDLAVHEGRLDGFVTRLDGLRMKHKTKNALLRRINSAGLRPGWRAS